MNDTSKVLGELIRLFKKAGILDYRDRFDCLPPYTPYITIRFQKSEAVTVSVDIKIEEGDWIIDSRKFIALAEPNSLEKVHDYILDIVIE